MKWASIIFIEDENDKGRFFVVSTSSYSTPVLYPGKSMCKIEATEVNANGSLIKNFHFYVNLTDTLVVSSSDKAMPTYFILDEMEKIVKSGNEQW